MPAGGDRQITANKMGHKPMNTSNKAWLAWLARLAFIAGLGIGAVGLAAPVGTWLGLWNFGTGFQLLFNPEGLNVTTVASWVAIAAIVVAVIAFVLANENKTKLGVTALIGAIAAGAAYQIPNSYRPGPDDNIPGIHDITTDTQNPPQFVDVLPLRADAPNTTVYGGGEGETPESLAALQQSAYPDIVTRPFQESPTAVFERAAAAARSLGWDIVAEVPAEGRIEATDTTFWFRFKDDIVIRIRPAGNGGAVLDARSVSRVGRGDAGKNAERLRAFFAAL